MKHLHPEVAELLTALRNLQHQLELHGESKWAESVRRVHDLVEQSDAYGVVKFLAMFGGMGSLNDLNFSEDFRVILSQTYNLAYHLRDEAN